MVTSLCVCHLACCRFFHYLIHARLLCLCVILLLLSVLFFACFVLCVCGFFLLFFAANTSNNYLSLLLTIDVSTLVLYLRFSLILSHFLYLRIPITLSVHNINQKKWLNMIHRGLRFPSIAQLCARRDMEFFVISFSVDHSRSCPACQNKFC